MALSCDFDLARISDSVRSWPLALVSTERSPPANMLGSIDKAGRLPLTGPLGSADSYSRRRRGGEADGAWFVKVGHWQGS
jgi:hypothetical protein